MNGMIQRLTRYKGLLLSITCFVGFGMLVLTDFGKDLALGISLILLFGLGVFWSFFRNIYAPWIVVAAAKRIVDAPIEGQQPGNSEIRMNQEKEN